MDKDLLSADTLLADRKVLEGKKLLQALGELDRSGKELMNHYKASASMAA